jgi:hypothetical protein
MKTYTSENARNDLEVIEWLLSAGAISEQDARFMRKTVQNMAS